VKVLVTGGCGFLGSHVCQIYRQRGWEVVAYDNMTKSELVRTGYQADVARDYNWDYLKDLGCEMVKGDIRHLDHLLDRATGCDYIVHTAAQPAVTISMEEPLSDLTHNVQGTVNVLETARQHDIPIVSCASVHVYGNWVNDELTEEETRYVRDPITISEDDPTMKGYLTPLHASKAAAEHYVSVYASTYGVRAASFRLTGIYGPRQLGGEDHGWVANFSIRNTIGWPVTIFGTGKQVRDILYATDVVQSFVDFFDRGDAGIYNIGGGEPNVISLLESIDLIDRTTGKKTDLRFEDGRFGDLRYFVCNIDRATNNFGWKPKVRPEEGIPMLIEWIQSNRELFSNG